MAISPRRPTLLAVSGFANSPQYYPGGTPLRNPPVTRPTLLAVSGVANSPQY